MLLERKRCNLDSQHLSLSDLLQKKNIVLDKKKWYMSNYVTEPSCINFGFCLSCWTSETNKGDQHLSLIKLACFVTCVVEWLEADT